MPIYNASLHLAECLDSVLAQTFSDFELIMVDDGSTDDSRSIAEAYSDKDPRFSLILQENSYAGAARNKGIDKASGDYLIFWDSDDLFDPEAVELLYNKISETDADIVVSGANQLDDETGKIVPAPHYFNKNRVPKDIDTFNRETNPDRILNFTTSVVWNKIFRRKFILDNGIRFQEIRNGNDIFFTVVALCKAKKISYVDKILMTYRKCQKSSLVGTLTTAPIVPINAWKDTALYLKSEDIFPGNSFANKAIDSMVYLLRNLPNLDAFTEAADYLKEGVLDTLGITDMSKDDYLVKWHADFVDVLLNQPSRVAFEWMYEFDYKRMAAADSEVKILKRDKKSLETKIKQLDGKTKELNRSIAALEADNKDLKKDLDKSKEDISRLNKKADDLKVQKDSLNKEIADIRGSVSFKIGRVLTFIPRKLKKMFKKSS